VAKKWLVLNSPSNTTEAAAKEQCFHVIDPEKPDTVISLMVSEREAAVLRRRMSRLGPRGTLWARFADTVVIEGRAPLPEDARDKLGLRRRLLFANLSRAGPWFLAVLAALGLAWLVYSAFRSGLGAAVSPAETTALLEFLVPGLLAIAFVLYLAARFGLIGVELLDGVRYYLRPHLPETPKVFRQWNFTPWSALAAVAMIGGVFTLENGQTFPGWMAIDYLVLVVAGLIHTVTYNQARYPANQYAAGAEVIGILALGIGIAVSSQATNPVTTTVTVASIDWTYSRGSGNYYELTAVDGSFYQLNPSVFTPPLPGGLDSPTLRGNEAMLTLDRGTRNVLAIQLKGEDYVTSELTHRSARQELGWLQGGAVALLGLVMAAIVLNRPPWLVTLRREPR
jgi:hypothetical protein